MSAVATRLNWGDTLCGVAITPKGWVGGIYTNQSGVWSVGKCAMPEGFSSGAYGQLSAINTTPIFPPKGWAGKSDAELWVAVAAERGYPYFGFTMDAGCITLRANDKGENDDAEFNDLCRAWTAGDGCSFDLEHAQQIIRDIQNALVLARRMGWVD